jgi:hypothetical protein
LRKVHLLSIQNLTPVEKKAMLDLSLVANEVLRLYQSEYDRYLELCTSNEFVKASHFVGIIVGVPPHLSSETTANISTKGTPCTPQSTQISGRCTNILSVAEYQTEKIHALEGQIQGLIEAAGNNANIAQDLQQTKAKLQRLEVKVASKKELSISNGYQTQMFVDPHRPVDETRRFEEQLKQVQADLCNILSRLDVMQNHQVRQDRELERVKLDSFISNRVLSRQEAYVFVETLLINACDTKGKPMNILVAGDGRFELYGKKYHIGKVCRKGKTKSLWKGKVEIQIKMEQTCNGINSIMDWFDYTDLTSIYERNKKQTILQMFSDELIEA